MSFNILPGHRSRRAALASVTRLGIIAGVALAGLQLSGCGGANPISLFYAPEQFANVGGRSVSLGRTFVKLDSTIPVMLRSEPKPTMTLGSAKPATAPITVNLAARS